MLLLRGLLHLNFQAVNRLDASASSGDERVGAGRTPNFTMNENFAGLAGRDRLANFSYLAY